MSLKSKSEMLDIQNESSISKREFFSKHKILINSNVTSSILDQNNKVASSHKRLKPLKLNKNDFVAFNIMDGNSDKKGFK